MTADGYPCDATPEGIADQWLYFDEGSVINTEPFLEHGVPPCRAKRCLPIKKPCGLLDTNERDHLPAFQGSSGQPLGPEIGRLDLIEYGGKRFRELFLRRAAQNCHNTEWGGALDLDHSVTGVVFVDPSLDWLETWLLLRPVILGVPAVIASD